MASDSSSVLVKYSKAVLSGFANGITGIVDATVVPISSAIYDAAIISSKNNPGIPGNEIVDHLVKNNASIYNDAAQRMSERAKSTKFVYDAAVIASKQSPGLPGNEILDHLVQTNPSLHVNANSRMRERTNAIKTAYRMLRDSPAEDKVQLATALATQIFIPGAVFKGIQHLANYEKLGVLNPPKKFHNVDTDVTYKQINIKTYNVDEIRTFDKGLFLYTITDASELRIAKMQHFEQIQRKVSGHEWLDWDINHVELARLLPVHAAGQFHVSKGHIVSIDNISGHYLPNYVQPEIIQTAFQRIGFNEVTKNLYEESFRLLKHSNSIITPGHEIPYKFTPIPGKLSIPDDHDKRMIDRDDKREVTSFIDPVDYGFMPLPSAIPDLNDLNFYDYSRCASNESDESEVEYQLHLCSQYYNPMIDHDVTQNLVANIEKSYNDYKLNVRDVSKFQTYVQSIGEIASLGSSVAQFAIMTGGHVRTWNNVAKVCSGLTTAISGINAMQLGFSALSMVGGFVGIAIGVMSIFSGLFGDDESDNGLQQLSEQMAEMQRTIMSALETIHNTIIEGFKHISIILLESVVPRLVEIISKLDHIEHVIGISFRELQMKSLLDIVDALQKDARSEYTIKHSKREKLLCKLSTWIDVHTKSHIQTGVLHNVGNDGKLVQVLQFFSNPLSIFPLFLWMIGYVTGIPIQCDAIPNVTTFLLALETYLVSSSVHGKMNTAVVDRAKITLYDIQRHIDDLASGPYIEILRRQYLHFKRLSGSQLSGVNGGSPCRTDYNPKKSIKDHLIANSELDKYMNLLDAMELRRLLLVCIGNVCEKKIEFLESKSDVLNSRPVLFPKCHATMKALAKQTINDTALFRATNEKYMEAWPSSTDLSAPKNIVEYVDTAFCRGYSVNFGDYYGRPIHYAAHYPKLMHNVLQRKEIEYNAPTTRDLGDTYGCYIRPILYALNEAAFECGILLCAQGHNINETNPVYGGPGWPNSFVASDMGNIYRSAYGAPGWSVSPYAKLTVAIVQEMNRADSKINRTSLRVAYEFYKSCQFGLFHTNKLSIGPISRHCILLLTCIIGDLYPILCSNMNIIDFQINQPIERNYNFTYLMLAVKNENVAVAKWLIEHGANIAATTTIGGPYKTAESFEKTTWAAVINNNKVNNQNIISNNSFINPYLQQIDGTIEIVKHDRQNDNSDDSGFALMLLLDLFEMDIEYLTIEHKQVAKEILDTLRKTNVSSSGNSSRFDCTAGFVAKKLDLLDSIYLIANKCKPFGYNLSAKIEKFISEKK